MKIAIYLAGSIQKGHEKHDLYWGEEEKKALAQGLSQYEVLFLNPAFRNDDLSDSRAVFGRDMLQVFSANIVFVDARDRRGVGVGAEMMWAKMNEIPVVTWAPRNSHYNKDETFLLGRPVKNFIHPFIDSLSDAIVENLADGCAWIDSFIKHPKKIKGVADINQAINHYRTSQFENDHPMKELSSHKEVHARMNRGQLEVIFGKISPI